MTFSIVIMVGRGYFLPTHVHEASKIIKYMGTLPEQYLARYNESYNKAFNRLIREFSNSFCREDGSIDWEKLVTFNSGD